MPDHHSPDDPAPDHHPDHHDDEAAVLTLVSSAAPAMDVSITAVMAVARARQRRRRLARLGTASLASAAAGAAIWVAVDGLAPEPFEPSAAQRSGLPIPPGEDVSVLGERYRVAVDAAGWPSLLDDEGLPFIQVTASDGPTSDGGVVYLGRGLRFWQSEATVSFYRAWQPPSTGEVVMRGADGEWIAPHDVLTIATDAGVVTVISVPEGTSATGELGLLREGEVQPLQPSP